MEKEKKKRNFFGSLERQAKKVAEKDSQTKPGEKSESEIRSYGVKFNRKKLTHKDRIRREIEKGVADARRSRFDLKTDREGREKEEERKKEEFNRKQLEDIVTVINGKLIRLVDLNIEEDKDK